MRRAKTFAWEFAHPLKRAVEEWLLLESHLRAVEKALQVNLSLYARGKKKGPEIILPQHEVDRFAMAYSFAVVTYMRCFGSGRLKRIRITDVPKLTPCDLDVHEEVRQLRNRHFAHATGVYESACIVIVNPREPSRAGFGVVITSIASGGSTHVRAFHRLVRKVLRYTMAQQAAAGDALAEAIFGQGATWAKHLALGHAAVGSDA